jgi:hypothetical protein
MYGVGSNVLKGVASNKPLRFVGRDYNGTPNNGYYMKCLQHFVKFCSRIRGFSKRGVIYFSVGYAGY